MPCWGTTVATAPPTITGASRTRGAVLTGAVTFGDFPLSWARIVQGMGDGDDDNRDQSGDEGPCKVAAIRMMPLTCCSWVELRGFEPLTPSMRNEILSVGWRRLQ